MPDFSKRISYAKVIGMSLLVSLIALDSQACSCSQISFEEAITNSDEIFIGRIVRIEELTKEYYEGEEISTGDYEIEFEVTKKWKGNIFKRITLIQPHTSCDFHFEFPANEYLVYAYKTDKAGYFSTWLCSRTFPAYYFNLRDEEFQDDKPLLDNHFSTPVKLLPIPQDWIIYLIAGLSSLIILVISAKRS